MNFCIFSQTKYEKIEIIKDPAFPEINEDKIQSAQLTVMREKENISVDESVSIDESDQKEKKIKLTKEKKNYSKNYKCEQCDTKYTWYSGIANHRRFLHKKQKGK